ncbi:aldo/keto reductase [Dyadobacter fanqingshengii]|uniref:Aldo/keto reductase n=1 Tax=Dyadobacter fanqingshengii TaxID=2906443 RepID=A0A9X1PCJ7_9BACT|nr:aldo/keto reductase [Dyadobacter fanqingshengii]MCF0042684.1 aldo/keto reductase [Dyadobacter fanqingshengii]MCF2504545.1 aldo/keto reductase [Dyadobacter fanqingshengii]USJ36092.1 aldo/keto reductase [Dyadobacter fanqingshengii]
MEYRQLGASGLKVPVLSFGTGTFGGGGDFFKAWGNTQTDEAARLVHLCMDAGITFFDTANVYSQGLSEEILGKAIIGLRDKIVLSTKATFKMGSGPNDYGSSRFHLVRSCEDSLRRLKTDYIDIYHMHGFDGNTPVEETLSALNDLITAGKVRYIACSNFSGWHLMKSLSVSEKYGWSKYIAHQAHYSLISREFEWELMPLGVDQNIGTIVWSPLSAGRLGGKYRRNQPIPPDGRIAQGGGEGPEIPEEFFFHLIDVLDELAAETGKTVAQVALNWLLQRPTVSNVVIGARNEEQLKQNLGAVGWNLDLEQVKKLDAASDKSPIYPYWHQRKNTALNPLPDFYGKFNR